MKTKLENSTLRISILICICIMIFNLQYTQAQMFWNQACLFAGNSGSYISIPNSSTLNVTANFTIEAWVNPSDISGTKAILSKGGVQGASQNFSLKLLTGRIIITTNGIERLRSRSSTSLKANQWTHISATYFSLLGDFKIYINGVLDTSSSVSGAAPLTNADSLFVGAAGSFVSYSGQMDEIRIWRKALSSTEIGRYYRTSLGVSSGDYSLLILSLTFQQNHSVGTIFSLYDWSENSNSAFGRNVSGVDLRNRPNTTIFQNESVEFDGAGDYLESLDSLDFRGGTSNSNSMQCWIYPKQNSAGTLIYASDGSTGSDFGLYINSSGKLEAEIENSVLVSNVLIPVNKWSHIAFNYRDETSAGVGKFYLNGKLVDTDTISSSSVDYNSPLLYIGGSPSLPGFKGFIDEVRVSQIEINESRIRQDMNISYDKRVSSQSGPFGLLSFNFDGLLKDNVMALGGGTRLKFVGNTRFSHPATIANQPVSPLNRSDDLKFTTGYYIKQPDKRIPGSGISGNTLDSIAINKSVSISDVNVFVAMNHTKLSEVSIVLIAPNGDSLNLFTNRITSGENDNLITIFDDNADSSLKNNAYTSFAPSIKPENNMNSVFGSDNAHGFWKIRINDNGGADTGRLYSWGIQINDMSRRELNFNLSALIQGFYNAPSNSMVGDTMRVYLWSIAENSVKDSATGFVNSQGNGLFSFKDFLGGVPTDYFILVKHRNAVETSSNPVNFPISVTGYEFSYDFRTDDSKAFGDNMVPVDLTPIRYAFYSGDQNQDGSVDLNDVVNVFNDANLFAAGYIASDMNGDNITDLSDVVLTFNNSNLFVVAITP